jgi:hypothetical protein
MDPDADQDLAIFVIDLQDLNKKLIYKKKIFCLLLFEGTGTVTSFFKDKKSKKSKKTVVIKFLEGSGSWRPKNMWIRWIRIRIRSGTLEKRYLLIMELPGLKLLALDAGLQLQALARTRGAILTVPVQRDKIFIWEPHTTSVQFKGESPHRTFVQFKGESSSHSLRLVISVVFNEGCVRSSRA